MEKAEEAKYPTKVEKRGEESGGGKEKIPARP